jgi:TPR repeat protein
MVGRHGSFGLLIGAAVGTLFLVPAQGLAQDTLSVSCADVTLASPLEEVTRCAQSGIAQSQFELGLVYSSTDHAESARWYRLAAEQGHDRAQYDLALMYAEGKGVPEDATEALRLYRLAADQGHSRAQFRLGRMHGRGDDLPNDRVLAYMWYDLAASRGHELARGFQGRIERQMSGGQIAEAQRLSREWMETHPQ